MYHFFCKASIFTFHHIEPFLNKKRQRSKFFILFSVLMSIFTAHCSPEKAISEKAYELEKKGLFAEAVYEYSRALDSNPEYGFANRRMGFILSESYKSMIPAIRHLEAARNTYQNDTELNLKLFDLTLFAEDYQKAEKLKKELSLSLSRESNDYIQQIFECRRNGDSQKKKLVSFFSGVPEPAEIKLIYRSAYLCMKKLEWKEKAAELSERFRLKGQNE